MWVDKWSKKEILYSGTGRVIFAWFVILVVIGGFVFVPYMNREVIFSNMEGRSGLEVIGIFSIFSIFFLICLIIVVSWTGGQFKFGKSIFGMSTHPGVVGGELAGTIHTRMRNIPQQGFDLEIQCEVLDLESGGRGVSPMPVTIWKAKKKVRSEELNMGPEGVSIPVSFSIPADAQESDEWSPLPVNPFETPSPATLEDGGFTSFATAWNERNAFSRAMGNTGEEDQP